MERPSWVPEGVPEDKPSAARMYDYYLGGYHNFAADRQAAEAVLANYPDAALGARANRAFLRRAIEFLTAQGVDQFLDVGSGIPTAGNVHSVAQAANPAARVVYVDLDPVAVAHGNLILKDVPNTASLHGDVRRPEEILDHPQVRGLLDFSRPIGVLMLALLHFVPDGAEASRSVQVLRDAVAPGSYLVISHGTHEHLSPEVRARGEEIYSRSANPVRTRSRAEIMALFDGLELVDPGLVYVPLWRPEGPDDVFIDQPERSAFLGGVGHKR
jgi:hypothetical protein